MIVITVSLDQRSNAGMPNHLSLHMKEQLISKPENATRRDTASKTDVVVSLLQACLLYYQRALYQCDDGLL